MGHFVVQPRPNRVSSASRVRLSHLLPGWLDIRFPSPTPDSSSTYEASEVSYCPLKQWRTNLHRAENNAKNPFGKMGPMPTNARRWRKLISLHLGFLS